MSETESELVVPHAEAWRSWLVTNHGDPKGVWLVLAKKGTTTPTTLTYGEALEEALRWGWIDGQLQRRDEVTYLQRFTPRRQRSPWSKRNKGTAERLIAQGRMEAPGLREVQRAMADGRWEAAYRVGDEIETPEDLAAALAAEPRAQALFEILTKQNRNVIIHRIQNAKRPETRRRRIEEHVTMLARGETPFHQKQNLMRDESRSG